MSTQWQQLDPTLRKDLGFFWKAAWRVVFGSVIVYLCTVAALGWYKLLIVMGKWVFEK